MEAIKELLHQYFLFPARYIFVLLVILIFVQIKRLLLYKQEKDKILVMLEINNSNIRIPITSYEVTIGRSKSCDVIINLPFISRQHAVLTMSDKGFWKLTDTKSKGGILINEQEATEYSLIAIGDQISLSGVPMVLSPATFWDAKDYQKERKLKQKEFITRIKNKLNVIGKKEGDYNKAMIYLNLLQILAVIQLFLTIDSTYYKHIFICFGSLFIAPWIFKIIGKFLKLQNMGAEATAFFLITIGFTTTASANPQDLFKQLACVIIGIGFYILLCMILKNLALIMKLRRYAAIISILLLLINLLLGTNINGQINWIRIGSFSIQPSEIVKVFFIFASSATLEWLLTTKNLRNLIVYAITCVGLLFLMGDFGTALIFFFTFIVLMFMTTGDLRAVTMTCIVAVLGALLLVSFKPYIIRRFNTWRNVWTHIYDSGSQQARALIAASSGGLLGLGINNGFSKSLYAADTDIVISMIMEEWGLIVAIIISIIYIIIMISAIRSYKVARSSYYVIAAIAAAGLFLFQAALNIFGAIDVLPFTGVTLPFISNGGSSMIGSFGLLSFLTASLNYARPKKNKAATPVTIGGDQ